MVYRSTGSGRAASRSLDEFGGRASLGLGGKQAPPGTSAAGTYRVAREAKASSEGAKSIMQFSSAASEAGGVSAADLRLTTSTSKLHDMASPNSCLLKTSYAADE